MKLIADTIDLSAYMDEQPQEHRVLPAGDWAQEVVDHFHKPDTAPRVVLPWKKTHRDFRFRDAEVTLWAGINGHGKSMLAGQVIHGLAEQGQRIALASLEMRPGVTMSRMVRQAYGADFPPAAYIQQYGKWTDNRLWIYDHVGSCNPKTMLAVIRYAIEKFGVQHFVVDNMMKVVSGEDDYNGQKDFVNGLCVIAKDTGCHIHLVLHVKKGRTEHDIPGKFDIKGSGAITDLVDNTFIVWRNKAKEQAMRSGDPFDAEDPDALLILAKQRNSQGEEDEGLYKLFFDRGSCQYLEGRTDMPKHCKVETGVRLEEVKF
jgi:twinkle protein